MVECHGDLQGPTLGASGIWALKEAGRKIEERERKGIPGRGNSMNKTTKKQRDVATLGINQLSGGKDSRTSKGHSKELFVAKTKTSIPSLRTCRGY